MHIAHVLLEASCGSGQVFEEKNGRGLSLRREVKCMERISRSLHYSNVLIKVSKHCSDHIEPGE